MSICEACVPSTVYILLLPICPYCDVYCCFFFPPDLLYDSAFPCSDVLLMTQRLIFLKIEGEPSLPVCFRIYVFFFVTVVLWLL